METVTAVLGLGALGFVLVTLGMFLVLVLGSLAAPAVALTAWVDGRRRRLAYARVAVRSAAEEVAR